MSLVDDAIRLAVTAHAGQVDKAGVPYIHHPLRVMELVRGMGGDDVQLVAAVLHDVIEDTNYEPEDVKLFFQTGGRTHSTFKVGRSLRILDKVTKKPNGRESNAEYLDRVLACEEGALLVKLADTIDNGARVELLDDDATKDRLREKYSKAMDVLDPDGKYVRLFASHAAVLTDV